MAASAQDSDIQIIDDYLTSHPAAGESGVPLQDRFRIFAPAERTSPQFNPASLHAFQKAYDDLKLRYNEVSGKNKLLERQLKNIRIRKSESGGLTNSRQRSPDFEEEMYDSNEMERDDSLQLRRRYFELSQEFRNQVDETSAMRQELLKSKKRISELENANRGLLLDNQKMTVNSREKKPLMKSNSDQITQIEKLCKRIQDLEGSYSESNKKCIELQRQLAQNKSSEQHYTDDLKAIISQVTDILQRQTPGSLSDDEWVTLVRFKLETATKEASEMASIIQQQQSVIQQMMLSLSTGTGAGKRTGKECHTLPKVMTRSAPLPFMAETDPDILVEYPSNAEGFPVILQPRTHTGQNRPLSDIAEANSENSSIGKVDRGRLLIEMSSRASTGKPSTPVRRASYREGAQRSSTSSRTGNGCIKAEQCAEDVFMENIRENKDAIMQEYIEEQTKLPLSPSLASRFHNPWAPREPVGTVFGVPSPEQVVPNDTRHVANEGLVCPTSAATDMDTEEPHSLRRDVTSPQDVYGEFSFLEDYKTTVQRLEDTDPGNRFAFELNDVENRRHPAAFNQQPRHLNIDRNYDEDMGRNGSYNNTSASRNVNLSSSSEGINKNPASHVFPRNPPVLNNDPLWTPKNVPTQNLFMGGQEGRAPPRPPGPHRHQQEERTCPVCDRDFPETMSQAEVEGHVNQCLNESMHAEETAASRDPPQTATPEAVEANPEDKRCPVCMQVFPREMSLVSLQHHINCHFETPGALNFEVLEPN